MLTSTRPSRFGAASFLLALLTTALTTTTALAQTIQVVAPVAGGSTTRIYAVNGDGTAGAGYSDTPASLDNAIRWTNLTGTVNMGLLPGGAVNSYAQAMDSSGTIIAGYGDSGSTRAYRWTTGGGYQLLPIVAGTGSSNQAFGISSNGSIVAGTSGFGGAARAFRWDASSPAVSLNLGVLSGQNSSSGLAVSRDGFTVVGASGSRAYRWTSAGGMVDLGSLPGQTFALAEAVNTDGTAITGRYSNGSEFGFRWTSATGMVALPQTPNGCVALRPRAMSGDGKVIIGQVVDNVAGFTAFVWTPALGSQLLATHLQLRGVNLNGWQLTDATGISADGSAMCGHGLFNGSPRGWVVRNLPCANLNSPLSLFGADACVGGNAIFDVSYSFQIFTTPSFRWWKDGVLLTAGTQPSGSNIANTNTNGLVITNIQPGDAGTYQVGISAQGACEVLSNTLVFVGPTVMTQNIDPVPTSACAGQNPFFFAVPNAPNIPPSSVQYRWQKLVTPPNVYANIFDGPSGNGGTYVGTGTSTFSILNAHPADSTRYRCVFSISGCGPSSNLITPNAPLTINGNTSFLAHPSDTSVCAGDNDAFFTVTATPIGGPFSYQWQRKNPFFVNVYNDIFNGATGNGGSYGGTQTASLSINGVYPGDFEYYRCVVTGPCGDPVASSDALLSPIPDPFVTGPTGGEGCPFGQAAMSVAAYPAGSTFQWQKYTGPCILCWSNISNGPTGNGGTFSGAQSATLTINGLDLFDTVTSYRCIVTGPCGATVASDEWTFTLKEQPSVQNQPVGGTVCINGTEQLSVTLAPGNYGNVSYQWWRYVPDFPIFGWVPAGTLPSGAVASGTTSPTLTISNFKLQDAGQYYCQITGDCGTTSSNVVTLVVCSADFNCSGSVTADDIFAFLDAWFAQNGMTGPGLSADFNNSDVVTADDIFAFLDAWFAQNGVCGN